MAVIILIPTLLLEHNLVEYYLSNASNTTTSYRNFIDFIKNESLALSSVSGFCLLLTFVLVVVMVVTLCCRACRCIGIASVNQKQHKKVLYEMMPLLVYPTLYVILMSSFAVIFTAGLVEGTMQYLSIAAIFLWSISSSCGLIIHVSFVLYNAKQKAKQQYRNSHDTREDVTIIETTTLVGRSETYYSLPTED